MPSPRLCPHCQAPQPPDPGRTKGGVNLWSSMDRQQRAAFIAARAAKIKAARAAAKASTPPPP